LFFGAGVVLIRATDMIVWCFKIGLFNLVVRAQMGKLQPISSLCCGVKVTTSLPNPFAET